jgi:putative FmdB family regulatory protein
MPTYQYKREDGTMFEIVQKISDDALKNCPETGQKVKRVITGGSGVVYKGSGWYVTDYKNRNGNGPNPANGTSGADPGTAGGASQAAGASSDNGSAATRQNGKGSAPDAVATNTAASSKDSGG